MIDVHNAEHVTDNVCVKKHVKLNNKNTKKKHVNIQHINVTLYEHSVVSTTKTYPRTGHYTTAFKSETCLIDETIPGTVRTNLGATN